MYTVADTASRYATSGHDFIFITDHRSPADNWAKAREYPIAVFDGVELDGRDGRGSFYHVVCLGTVNDIDVSTPFETAMEICQTQGGMMILAHPAWTGNTLEDVSAFDFHGIEVYNNICRFLNGKGFAVYPWDYLLERNSDIVGISCDDAHFEPQYPAWNGGWVMVQAAECTQSAVIEALRSGRFYSTQGPEIHSLQCNDGVLQAKTSPIQTAWLVGERDFGDHITTDPKGKLTEIRRVLPENYQYIRLEVEDAAGRRAWTNTLFTAK